jgi:SpoVK/Ycf46/Vps4 family AAA+-type ATPase
MDFDDADVIHFEGPGLRDKTSFTAEVSGLLSSASGDDDVPTRIAVFPGEFLADKTGLMDTIPKLLTADGFDAVFDEAAAEDSMSEVEPDSSVESLSDRIEDIRSSCNEFEKLLLDAVVQPGRLPCHPFYYCQISNLGTDDIKITFDDIRVDAAAIRTLRTLTTMSLMYPEVFKYGVLSREKVSGVLLHGPPGTGKTMMAKAVAKEANIALLNVSGADFQSKWLGESTKLVRAIFTLANKLDPCVIFIDEADSVFGKRGTDDSHWQRELISQFLLEWDGVRGTGFVLAATNRLSDIDMAILRRLPRQIFIGNPDQANREAILRIHLEGEKLGEDADLTEVAKRTAGRSGSDLKNVCFAAAMAAVYEMMCDMGYILDESKEGSEKQADHGGAAKRNGRKRRHRKRILCWRHFEQALSEICGQTNVASKIARAEEGIKMDEPTLAGFKKFGKLYEEAS